MSFSNSSSASTATTVVAALATIFVARAAWANTPSWLKQSLLLENSSCDSASTNKSRNSNSNNNNGLNNYDNDKNGELTNPMNLFKRMQEVMKRANSVFKGVIPDDMPKYQLQTCFVATLHSMDQIVKLYPDYREKYFSHFGKAPDATEEELEELVEYLEYADIAYNPSYQEVQSLLRRVRIHGGIGTSSGGYKLIRHDPATEPGRVGHYIAVHHGKKQILIAIKGTSTISDALTDLVARAVPHMNQLSVSSPSWPSSSSSTASTASTASTSSSASHPFPVSSHNESGNESVTFPSENRRGNAVPTMRCHEGMYMAAKMMLDDTLHLLEHFFLPQHYKIVITGHSHGAGVACLLGMLLKEKLTQKHYIIMADSLRVYAYATPVCCSYEASLRCQDYITSVVNNNDCIPRLSMSSLRRVYELFLLVRSKLNERGLCPKNYLSSKRLIRTLLSKMAANDNNSGSSSSSSSSLSSLLLLRPDDITNFIHTQLEKEREENEQGKTQEIALYVPGRVVSIWNHTTDPSIVGGKVTDGTSSPVIRQIQIETDMISDHFIESYRQNLIHLLEQTANTI